MGGCRGKLATEHKDLAHALAAATEVFASSGQASGQVAAFGQVEASDQASGKVAASGPVQNTEDHVQLMKDAAAAKVSGMFCVACFAALVFYSSP